MPVRFLFFAVLFCLFLVPADARDEPRRTENAIRDAALASQAVSITLNAGAIRRLGNRLEQAGDCSRRGRLFGPGQPRADVAGCLDIMEILPTDRTVFAGQEISSVRAGDDALCDGVNEGAIRYAAAHKALHFCDGSVWREIAAAPIAYGPFAAVGNVPPGAVVTSEPATVAGFAGLRPAIVGGPGRPVLIVNGKRAGALALVKAGDRIAIRVKAPGSHDTARTVTLTAGALHASWTVTTGTGE